MKNLITILSLTVAISTQSQNLFIHKIASPVDEKTNGKFVTLYNASADTIDFESNSFYLSKETNGSGSISSKKLSGKVAPNNFYVIAGKSAFKDVYLSEPNCIGGCVTGNGNDAYMLYKNGDHSTGTLIDIYGEIGKDGIGLDWDYTDALATRNETTLSSSTTWNKNEWTITKDLIAANANPWNIKSTSTDLVKSKFELQVNIYPNPCTSNVTLSSKYQIQKILVKTIIGSTIYQLDNLLTNQITINTSNYPKGIYLIELDYQDGGSRTERFVKR